MSFGLTFGIETLASWHQAIDIVHDDMAFDQRVVPRDLLAGKIGLVNPSSPNAKKIGGTYPLPDGGWLVTAYDAYDGGGSSDKSHFRVSASGQVTGPFLVGRAGFTAGWMLPIPPEWQSAFGAPALTGVCCLSVIGRTSVGPTVTTFDPARDAQPGTLVLTRGGHIVTWSAGQDGSVARTATDTGAVTGQRRWDGLTARVSFATDGRSVCWVRVEDKGGVDTIAMVSQAGVLRPVQKEGTP